MDDNKFIFSSRSLEEFTFDTKDYGHAIKNPGDWGGVTSRQTPEGGEVIVRASRHGDEGVAEWFRNRTTMLMRFPSEEFPIPEDLPDKLNFAIQGDLRIKKDGIVAEFKGMLLAQGHSGMSNPWYVGGKLFDYYRATDASWSGWGRAVSGISCLRCKKNVSIFMNRRGTYEFGVNFDLRHICDRGPRG